MRRAALALMQDRPRAPHRMPMVKPPSDDFVNRIVAHMVAHMVADLDELEAEEALLRLRRAVGADIVALARRMPHPRPHPAPARIAPSAPEGRQPRPMCEQA